MRKTAIETEKTKNSRKLIFIVIIFLAVVIAFPLIITYFETANSSLPETNHSNNYETGQNKPCSVDTKASNETNFNSSELYSQDEANLNLTLTETQNSNNYEVESAPISEPEHRYNYEVEPTPVSEPEMKTCDMCNGSGKVDCFCANDISCHSCNGEGKKARYSDGLFYMESCFLCHGTGERQCVTCHNTRKCKCYRCNGTGEIKVYN